MSARSLAAFLIALSPIAAAAEGTNGALLMKRSWGARPLALADSYVSLSDDPYALVFNPAGLGLAKRGQVAVHFGMGLADSRLHAVHAAQPLGRWGGAGVGLARQDLGTIDIYNVDGTVQTRRAKQDTLVSLGYGYVTRPDLDDFGRFGAGIAIKHFRSTLVEEAKASASALDLGALWETPWGVTFGASLSNLGPGVGYEGGRATGAEDPLPRTLRVGGSYAPNLLKLRERLLVAADLAKTRDESAELGFGFEYAVWRYAAFRLGYRTTSDLGGLTTGVGLNLGRFRLDYGFGLMSAINNLHTISFGLEFGPRVFRPSYKDVKRRHLDELSLQPQQLYEKGFLFRATEAAQRDPRLPHAGEVMEKVDAWLMEAIQKGPGVGGKEYHYAAAYRSRFREKRPAKLVADLEQALAYDPGNEELEEQLARARVEAAGKAQEAGKNAQELYLKAFELYKAKKYNGAIDALRESLRQDPNHEEALKLLDMTIQASTQRSAPPRPAAPKTPASPAAPRPTPIKVDEARLKGLYRQALIAYSQGDVAEARRLLEDLLRLDPDYEPAQRAFSRIDAEKGLP